MKIGIVGTRGIPNRYGGFEQCAENLAPRLVQLGNEVLVFSPDSHPFREPTWRGVEIVRVPSHEKTFGAFGTIRFDLACIRKAIERECDVVLALGYTPVSMFFGLLRRAGIPVVTNMDGLEWKRSKWPWHVRRFIRWNEGMAARNSTLLVGDNPAICQYLKAAHNVDSTYIAYGSDHISDFAEDGLSKFGLAPQKFDLVIARMEPENNISMILQGYLQARNEHPLVVVGRLDTKFGRQIVRNYARYPGIKFLGPIFDLPLLNALRRNCRYYLHGHTVGGTNPSLLEAMAAGAMVIVHDNSFNRAVVGQSGMGFSDARELGSRLSVDITPDKAFRYKQYLLGRLDDEFTWAKISQQYHELLKAAVKK